MRRNKKRHVPLQGQGQGQGQGQRQRQPVIKCGTSSASQEQGSQPRDDHHYRPPTSPPNNHTNKPCLAQHELARPVRSAERPRGATSDGGAATKPGAIYRKDETETVSHSLITKFETKKKNYKFETVARPPITKFLNQKNGSKIMSHPGDGWQESVRQSRGR